MTPYLIETKANHLHKLEIIKDLILTFVELNISQNPSWPSHFQAIQVVTCP